MTKIQPAPVDPLNPTLDEAAMIVADLVQDFSANERYYLSGEYVEAQARLDFIDKFLVALGWDVPHRYQQNPFEQEVKVERNIQSAVAQRRADYALALAPHVDSPVLYVEAKKPGDDIATADNCFQMIRYANQREHPIGILTNFAQLHVIDCRYPAKIETAMHCFARKYAYTEFTEPEKWAEIYHILSRGDVHAGSIARFAQSLPKLKPRRGQKAFFPRAYKPLDERLLETLDELRERLARALKYRNASLDSHQLTELTQRILDRLVFIRFLEDKLIEPSAIIPKLGQSGRTAWHDFLSESRHLDEIYNGIVFKRHDLLDDAEALEIDERAFAEILDEFDYHKSSYLFNDIPLHILGSIYERFLGNVIVATEKRATLQPKPEVRKAGGVYYTPKYIVDYIVENTVGQLIAGKTPNEIAKLRFADIACGSGSFLLGIYDCLLKYVTRWYNENPTKTPASAVVKAEGVLHLSLKEKTRILLNNVYGVDIDPQAVEVAQLSLYLKLLEDETTASAKQYSLKFHQPLLPLLSNNIKCGNSLVGSDFYNGQQMNFFDEREQYRINVFDWRAQNGFGEIMKQGGFDAVIGNPPYVNIRVLTQVQSEHVKQYFERTYDCARRGYDLYVLFVERGSQILKPAGLWGMIVPNKLGTLDYATRCRELLLGSKTILSIVDTSEIRVFSDASVYPYVLIWANSPPKAGHSVRVIHAKTPDDFSGVSATTRIEQAALDAATGFTIHGALDVENRVPTQPLDQRTQLDSGTTGFVAQQMARSLVERSKRSPAAFDFIVSGNIDRYSIDLGNVRFMKRSFIRPLLPKNSAILTKGKVELYSGTKIVIAGMTKRIEAAWDDDGLALGVQVFAASKLDDPPFFVLALLNSKLLSYLFRLRFQAKHLAGGFLAINMGQLAKLPIRVIEDGERVALTASDKIVSLVKRMHTLGEQLPTAKTDHAKIVIQRQIEATDRQIDQLVYQLYGLNDDEIALVEAASP